MATPYEILDSKPSFLFPKEMECNPFEIHNSQGEIILAVRKDGSIKWKGKEVESDEELREAVKEMLKTLTELRTEMKVE